MAGAVQSAGGLVVLTLACWAWGALGARRRGSAAPRAVPWRLVLAGLAAQLVLAALMLWVPPLRAALGLLGDGVAALQRATEAGTGLVFGYLGGAPLPFAETVPGASFILAFRALPLVLVVGALSALLYHWGVIPAVVGAFARLLGRGLGLSGPASFATAANVFVGMVEAPLMVRPYLAALSASELFVVMTAGLATISGNMLAVYAIFLREVIPDAAGQLLAASVISAPAAVVAARLMVPPEPGESGRPESAPPVRLYQGSMDAIARGTQDGLALMLGIIAMLIVAVALVSLVNQALVPATTALFGAPVSLQAALGWLLRPVAFAMGIPWAEAAKAGEILGLRTIVNEFVAYLALMQGEAAGMAERSRVILVYGLCGFANLGSLGIMLGGLVAMVPERRADILRLGGLSVVSGTAACCMTGAAVGILI